MSSTFKKNIVDDRIPVFSIRYGTGKINGEFVSDRVSVAGLTVDNQTFGLTYIEEGNAFLNVPFEGILGLSFPTVSKTNHIPFFDNVITSKLLRHNIFSIFLALEESKAETGSSIQFGEVDKQKMLGNFTFVDVVSENYWELDINEIKIGNQTTSFCSTLRKETGRCGVAIDSGTSLYACPTE